MAAPTKLFLDRNSIDHQWKVLDKDSFCFGSGDTPEAAIESARIVTNAPIYANSDFKGIIDGKPVLGIKYTYELSEDTVLFGSEELIEAMAELGGFKVHKVLDDDRYVMGYAFEVVE